MYEFDQSTIDLPRHQADSNLLVRFFKHPRKNEARTKEEGREIYEEQDYVQIMQPGNKDSIISRPATPRDKQRFAEHFAKYQARETESEHIEGTLLSEWPALNRAQVEELKFLNIHTVEQLANVADSNAQNIMGIQLLKQKAATYLETAKDTAVAEALADAKAENEELRSQVSDLAMKVELLTESKPRKRRTKAQIEADEAAEDE